MSQIRATGSLEGICNFLVSAKVDKNETEGLSCKLLWNLLRMKGKMVDGDSVFINRVRSIYQSSLMQVQLNGLVPGHSLGLIYIKSYI